MTSLTSEIELIPHSVIEEAVGASPFLSVRFITELYVT